MRRCRSHRTLERKRKFPGVRSELARVLDGYAWSLDQDRTCPERDSLKVVSWNIERGAHFDRLVRRITTDTEINDFDLLLLNEVDLGMGRSGNRDVARALAEAADADFIFANSHLVLVEGDAGERGHGVPNNWALHGTAVLSRVPIRRFLGVGLPEYVDKLGAKEQRLGRKRALIVEVLLAGEPCLVAAVHLDPFAPSRHRAAQLRYLNASIEQFQVAPCLIGGDLNTLTYNFASPLSLAANLMEKAATIGVTGTVQHYMVPELRYERPVFETLDGLDFEIRGFNERRRGTLFFDANDPATRARARTYMPALVYDRMCRLCAPWDGRVPMRADWFAGRNLEGGSPQVISLPAAPESRISDHDPISVVIRRR